MKYKDIEVQITFEKEESKKHLEKDFNVLLEVGIDNLIKEQFIPWIVGTNFKDRDQNKIFEGLKLYEICYHYGRIIEKYSPIGEENYFGQFEFCFESGSEYTDDILESVAMEVYVLDGKVVKVGGYDI